MIFTLTKLQTLKFENTFVIQFSKTTKIPGNNIILVHIPSIYSYYKFLHYNNNKS